MCYAFKFLSFSFQSCYPLVWYLVSFALIAIHNSCEIVCNIVFWFGYGLFLFPMKFYIFIICITVCSFSLSWLDPNVAECDIKRGLSSFFDRQMSLSSVWQSKNLFISIFFRFRTWFFFFVLDNFIHSIIQLGSHQFYVCFLKMRSSLSCPNFNPFPFFRSYTFSRSRFIKLC